MKQFFLVLLLVLAFSCKSAMAEDLCMLFSNAKIIAQNNQKEVVPKIRTGC